MTDSAWTDADARHLLPSLVGRTITAASLRSTSPGFGEDDELTLELDDGRMVRVNARGYDEWNLDFYETGAEREEAPPG